MKLLSLCVMSITLAGLSSVRADEQREAATGAELEQQPGWAQAAQSESSISAQANAMMAALREKISESEGVPDEVYVVDLDDQFSGTIRDGNGTEGCIFMERPGSRIRDWRCYYPNEGEKALNQYQFKEEIRYAIQSQQIRAALAAEAEAMEENRRQAQMQMQMRR